MVVAIWGKAKMLGLYYQRHVPKGEGKNWDAQQHLSILGIKLMPVRTRRVMGEKKKCHTNMRRRMVN